jgi:hypothetical protein
MEANAPGGRGSNMTEKAFQDFYPDDLSYCYGCGRLNEDGLQLKSYWDGDETVAVFDPRPSHMAIPGIRGRPIWRFRGMCMAG